MKFATIRLADALAALVEAQEQRGLHASPSVEAPGLVVAQVRLRDLERELAWHLLDVEQKGGGRLAEDVALVCPHLLEPGVANDPSRTVGYARLLDGAEVRVHQPALVHDVVDGAEVVDSEPDEALVRAVGLLGGHAAVGQPAQRGRGGRRAQAHVRDAVVLLNPPNGSRPEALHRDAQLARRLLVDAAGEDAPPLRIEEVLPEPVRRHVPRAEARRAAPRQVHQRLLDVPAPSQGRPAAVELGVGLLRQAGPAHVGPELGGDAERVVLAIEGQLVVNGDGHPLAVLVEAEGVDA
mmetsp:Transcript_109545/g.285522  ORF Transcript_109545/g.285522 Transcript_109545/m.285522 type:complete len:295 (+) Transcript_109545:547-1431(+)